jgi:hypothetical protein
MQFLGRSVLVTLLLLLGVSAMSEPLKTRNVVFVVSDGLRWQEVFNGIDPVLMKDKSSNWLEAKELKARYWDEDVQKRRARLMPFLWGTMAKEGQIFGNRALGSLASVTNDQWFSYPGYNEMSSGVADPKIRSNQFGVNPNVTVYEWLNNLPELKGKVEIYGTWDTFRDIFNEERSHLTIRAGTTLIDKADTSPRGQLLRELYETQVMLEDPDPTDAMLHVVLRDHLAKVHPRVLFVGYGDTDNFAHMNRYDSLLSAAQHADAFVADLWKQLQSIPEYKGTTTLIFTADHGRGRGRHDWIDHGVEEPGSDEIWVAVMGPDVPALGERRNVAPIKQAQLAATVAAFMGQEFQAFKPEAAASLLEALSVHH